MSQVMKVDWRMTNNLIITDMIDLRVLKMYMVTTVSGNSDFENCLFSLLIALAD